VFKKVVVIERRFVVMTRTRMYGHEILPTLLLICFKSPVMINYDDDILRVHIMVQVWKVNSWRQINCQIDLRPRHAEMR